MMLTYLIAQESDNNLMVYIFAIDCIGCILKKCVSNSHREDINREKATFLSKTDGKKTQIDVSFVIKYQQHSNEYLFGL